MTLGTAVLLLGIGLLGSVFAVTPAPTPKKDYVRCMLGNLHIVPSDGNFSMKSAEELCGEVEENLRRALMERGEPRDRIDARIEEMRQEVRREYQRLVPVCPKPKLNMHIV